jgi:ABC-type cobalamin/Fe3+-siderophores transport system ATPase subunit
MTALDVIAPPLVSLRNLSVELGGKSILRGVTADVRRGAVTALIGLNGSGKTTLLRALRERVPAQGDDPVPLRARPHEAVPGGDRVRAAAAHARTPGCRSPSATSWR